VSGQRIPDGAEPSHADATTTRSAPSSALKTSLMPWECRRDVERFRLRAGESEIPFGGYKMSGIGREHGAEAIHEYSQAKSITVGKEELRVKICVFGAGAIGGYVAAQLWHAGNDV
jgi:hypothetical protein